jgi:hypothetical protein
MSEPGSGAAGAAGAGEDAVAAAGGEERPLEDLEALAERLRSLAEQLRDPELADDRAAELAREAADVVGQAGNELDRALADAADEPS